MLNGSPFLNQSLLPTQSLTFRFMGTVGNLNIKAAAVIDSCLLIFQGGPMLLHHRQSLSLFGYVQSIKDSCTPGKRPSTSLNDTCSLQLGVELEKQE